MADDKNTISPDVGTPTEAPEQPSTAPDLSDTAAPAPLEPEALTVDDAADCARWGNATAAVCVTRRGAIPAMPSLAEAEALLAE